jgi:DNA-directed RNA polymerase specialized sigma24 family protein
MKDQVDAKTIRGFMEGSTTAARRVFQHYLPIVYTWGKRDLRDLQLADEYVQDVFLLAWQSRKSIGRLHRFDDYLFNIARRLLYIHLRQATREQMGTNAGLKDIRAKEVSVDRLIIDADIEENLRRELAELKIGGNVWRKDDEGGVAHG